MKIKVSRWRSGMRRGTEENMPATGEIIRMMNYVDDIATTLRRITANLAFMTAEEKKRLADYMRKADPNYVKVLEQLEKSQ